MSARSLARRAVVVTTVLPVVGAGPAVAQSPPDASADVVVEALVPVERGCRVEARTESGERLELLAGTQLCAARARDRLLGRWMEVRWTLVAWEACETCPGEVEVAQLREIRPSRAHESRARALARVLGPITALVAVGLAAAALRTWRERRAFRTVGPS